MGSAKSSYRGCARTALDPPREWLVTRLLERVVSAHPAAKNTPPAGSPAAQLTTLRSEMTCRSQGRGYLTIAGISFFAAQINATNHPITLQPRNKLSRKIARRSRLLRARAMIDGRKYITNPKPKNGKKKKCARTMEPSFRNSVAPFCGHAAAAHLRNPRTTR